MVRKLILTASKQSDNDEVIEPIPSSRTFFEQKNPLDATAYLYHKLNIELNLPIYIPVGLATSIHTGVPPGIIKTPFITSPFIYPSPQSSSMMSNTEDSIVVSLECSNGCGDQNEDICCLTRQITYIPITVNKLGHHIISGLHILIRNAQ